MGVSSGCVWSEGVSCNVHLHDWVCMYACKCVCGRVCVWLLLVLYGLYVPCVLYILLCVLCVLYVLCVVCVPYYCEKSMYTHVYNVYLLYYGQTVYLLVCIYRVCLQWQQWLSLSHSYW